MRLLFVMDPPATVLVDEDTSFAIMLEAQAQGHQVDHCQYSDLYLEGGRLSARVRPATMQRQGGAPITLADAQDLCLEDLDAVFVRTDPPFDSHYLWMTLMLERLAGHTLVINRPSGLRNANEKLYACHFPELMPQTLVSGDKTRIKDFVTRVGGRAVIKPLDGAGGEGVMALMEGDLNINAIIESTTRHGERLAMIQAFLPKVTEGDKRILLLEGQPLGAIVRVPASDDMRSNIHVGGTVIKGELDDADRKIIATLKPRLIEDGLYFVGLDVIGGKLTEVNVTSPTGIQQMTRLDNVNHSAKVIEWVAAKVGG